MQWPIRRPYDQTCELQRLSERMQTAATFAQSPVNVVRPRQRVGDGNENRAGRFHRPVRSF